MKIQLLSYRNGFDKYSVVHNNMDTPHTFDSFDVNIVDLNDKNIFVNKDTDQKNINKKVEVQQLKKIIERTSLSVAKKRDCNKKGDIAIVSCRLFSVIIS